MNIERKTIHCDGGWNGCTGNASMIGNKGYAYCTSCGPSRRASGYERVRKLKPRELAALLRGEILATY